MHALPANIYADGHKRFAILRLLTWANLDEALQQSDPNLAEEIRGWFDQISDLNAQQLINEATPFWWFNVGQCWSAAMDGSPQTAEYAGNMMLAAFDSFFTCLPDGATIRVDGNREIMLPKLGINVGPTLKPTALTRSGTNTIGIDTADGKITMTLDDDSGARLSVPDHAEQYVLCAPTPALIGDDPRAELTGADFDSSAFTQMLGNALSLIQNECRELYDQIQAANNWYIPIVSRDIRVHRSYTRADLTGVIFLSEALDHVLLGEAVVHEFYHGVLNSILKTEPLFDETESSETFYSPWRDDPRPLRGLLHAIYVFSGVARFYALANNTLARSEYAGTVRLRRSKLHQQLRCALAQVPLAKLTPVGRQVIEAIASQVNNQVDDSDLSDPGAAAVLEDHLKAWRERNPALQIQPH